MLVLHSVWQPGSNAQPAHLALWGESGPEAAATARPGRAQHPFSAPPQALSAALHLAELNVTPEESALSLRLPTLGKGPQPSRSFLLADAPTGKAKLKAWAVPALRVAPRDALAVLINLPGPDDEAPGLEIGADARFWQAAARWALGLLAGQQFKATLEPLHGQRSSAPGRPSIEFLLINEDRREAVLGTALWSRQPMGPKIVKELIQRSQHIQPRLDEHWRLTYVYFSRAGFAPEARQAGQNCQCQWVSLEAIDRALARPIRSAA